MIKGVEYQSGEELVHVVRQALMPRVHWVVLAVLLFVVPLVFVIQLSVFGWVGIVPLIVFSAIGLVWLIRLTRHWRGTILVLTNQRMIYVVARGLFERQLHKLNLQDIRDVAYRCKGWQGRLFKTGSVRVRPKGVRPPIVLTHIKDPATLHAIMSELQSLPAYKQGSDADFDRISFDT